ncbi:hypothetical protein M8818_006427 [Zalaria obscura]|uniref:Uncharacterized protein n=1 Tax=Zalaria obscura TaxID=2024903 RepID=A0ACC3S5P1_9PEZI
MAIDTNPGEKVISPAKLAHVVLRTNNLQPMVDFYQTFLGAKIQYANDFLAFLTYDDEHHRIAIAQLPGLGAKVPQSCGLEHIAFTFNTLSDLLTAYRQRKAHGMLPQWCVNHGPTTSIYYLDPDGNRIETQVDAFGTSEEANAFMASKEFSENPLGVDFDPEELIGRVERGEDEKVLLKRVEIGPRGLESIPI